MIFIRKSNIILLIVFLLIILSFNKNLFAEELSGQNYYSLDAEDISYHASENLVMASGNITFEADGLIIETDKLSINIKDNVVTTLGNEFLLITTDREIKGERLSYNYKNNIGSFYNAESEVDNLNFRGEKIELVEEKDYNAYISESSFTKCILDEPHYQIKAEKLKIYPDNKVVAENVQFWWGKTKLFSLASYVMEYKTDEETGEEKLGSSSPVPRIGYNSADGLIFEFNYPYEITENSTGKAYMNVVQQGSQLYKVNHTHNFSDKTIWKGNYSYDKDVEEFADSEDNKITINKSFSSKLSYDYNENITIFNKYDYISEKENGVDPDLEKKVLAGFNYNKNNTNLSSVLGYDLVAENRIENIALINSLPYSHVFEMRHDYIDEELEKEIYNIYSSGNVIDWSLKYKEGYNLDQLPYLELDFMKLYGFKTDLGFGILKKEDNIFEKAKFDLAYKNRVDLSEQLYFIVDEKYVHHLYKKENNDEINKYSAFLTDLTFGTDFEINDTLDLSTSLNWEKDITEGEYLISDDELKEKNNLIHSINFKFKTPQPESHVYFKNTAQYNLDKEEWEKVKLHLRRKLDCHSYSINYEIINKVFTIEFNIF